MVELNRIVAVAMVHGPEAGLRQLAAAEASPGLAGHHRLDAVRAHLLGPPGPPRGAPPPPPGPRPPPPPRRSTARATRLATRS